MHICCGLHVLHRPERACAGVSRSCLARRQAGTTGELQLARPELRSRRRQPSTWSWTLCLVLPTSPAGVRNSQLRTRRPVLSTRVAIRFYNRLYNRFRVPHLSVYALFEIIKYGVCGLLLVQTIGIRICRRTVDHVQKVTLLKNECYCSDKRIEERRKRDDLRHRGGRGPSLPPPTLVCYSTLSHSRVSLLDPNSFGNWVRIFSQRRSLQRVCDRSRVHCPGSSPGTAG